MKVSECDFCGTKETKENRIIKGPKNNICKSCVETSLYLLELEPDDSIKNTKSPKAKSTKPKVQELEPEVISPKYLKKILDDYVVGQEEAKKILSTAVYNHIKRIENPDLNIEKNNVLFQGPTATGKTFLIQTLAKYLDIPLAIADATTLTASGYVGSDVSSILRSLWEKAGKDIEKAEKGIILIDEIDKIATVPGGSGRDISGRSVQQELLKILEDNEVRFTVEPSRKEIVINTKNILFLVAGAFVGLNDKGVVINSFGNKKETEKQHIGIKQKLIQYGLIPEFIGRFTSIALLNTLTEDNIKQILIGTKDNLITKYQDLFKLDNIDINFTEKTIDAIVSQTFKYKDTGARELKSIMADITMPYTFDIDAYANKKIVIDYNTEEDNYFIQEHN